MRRVVVTGLGIVSCIGNDAATVIHSLKRTTISGIRHNPTYAEMGFKKAKSRGRPDVDLEATIDRKPNVLWVMPPPMLILAMQQTIADAGLSKEQYAQNPRVG